VITAGTPGQEIVLLGNGDGTFQLPTIVSTGTNGAISSVVGDFNGDGKLDLATSSLSTGRATAFLQLGNGDGTFQAPTTACKGPYSESAFEFEDIALANADLNGDGKLDLVLTADLIDIYLGNGDGSPVPPITISRCRLEKWALPLRISTRMESQISRRMEKFCWATAMARSRVPPPCCCQILRRLLWWGSLSRVGSGRSGDLDRQRQQPKHPLHSDQRRYWGSQLGPHVYPAAIELRDCDR
jgi:hypothetical protein